MGTTTSTQRAPRNDAAMGEFFTDEQLNAMFRGFPPQIPVAPPPVVHTARTIKNDVNLIRDSLAVVPAASNPSQCCVRFRFDSARPCSVTVYLCVTETTNHANFTTRLKPSRRTLVSRRSFFESGSNQTFSQAEHKDEGFDVASVSNAELKHNASNPDKYPLVILLEAMDSPSGDTSPALEFSDSSSVQSQLTYASMERRADGTFSVSVLKQKIQANTQAFELRAIYGIEKAGTPEGGDCVVCLSAPKDTTVLPCRHMCLCRECADQLRMQTNKCPICRAPVESLLKIDLHQKELGLIRDDEEEDNGAGAGAPAVASTAVTAGLPGAESVV